MSKQEPEALRERFRGSGRKHVLMITNHGVHEWEVTPGLTDTGGQNVYVNQFTASLVDLGFRVTIVNRGGYPHPVTGEPQRGERYAHSGHARIWYIEDSTGVFVRKEDMNERLPDLADDLRRRLRDDGQPVDLIISHYWDGGKLGTLINGADGERRPHLWVPHSLGTLKKRRVDPSTWADLRIDERIGHERELLRHVDGAVATSSAIRASLRDDYGHEPHAFLPPCIDEKRYSPRSGEALEPVWSFLAAHSTRSAEEIRSRPIVLEVSRTTRTKRKDVLLRAFAEVCNRVPQALLVVSMDEGQPELYASLTSLMKELGLSEDVIVVGSVQEELPLLHAAASVYCTPSVMEGFGMSAQEAAAAGTPVVASDLVPFAVEHLLGGHVEEVRVGKAADRPPVRFGDGGVVVPADAPDAFATALVRLLEDPTRRDRMGRRAREITVPEFTWHRRTRRLLAEVGMAAEAETGDGTHSY